MSLILDEHRQYLSDAARLDAFDRALRAVVRPSDVVVDLGCGTGILGLLACRAGARRVYAIDDGGMIDVAREAARANGYADRIVHIASPSMRVSLPETPDLVVSDQIGRLGFEAGIVEYYADAHRRWLSPESRVVPSAVTTWAAPVERPDLHAQVDFWREPHAGFSFAAVRDAAVNTGYPALFALEDLLAPGAPVVRYELADRVLASRPAVSGSTTFEIARNGTLHGIAGWFGAELVPGVTMTNAPGAPARIGRRQSFLPIDRPTPVMKGDVVTVALVVRPADVMLVWRVRLSRAGRDVGSFEHSTLRGMLLTRDDLLRMRPDAQPRLGEWAQARRSVIAFADGTRPLIEIERLTYEAHRDLFVEAGAAAAFVAAVISRDDGGGSTDSV